MLPVFPIVSQVHDDIDKAVVKIRDDEKEKRQDLHVLAASYWGHLKVRKLPLVHEEDFHVVDDKRVPFTHLFCFIHGHNQNGQGVWGLGRRFRGWPCDAVPEASHSDAEWCYSFQWSLS